MGFITLSAMSLKKTNFLGGVNSLRNYISQNSDGYVREKWENQEAEE